MIAAEESIRVDGQLLANGGDGGSGSGESNSAGGAGSGGAFRLMAPVISGTGLISTKGGSSAYWALGSAGRISLETSDHQFVGQAEGTYRVGPILRPVFPPSELTPELRLARVGGQDVPVDSRGRFDVADLRVEQGQGVLLELESRNIPLGTAVELTLVDEIGTQLELLSSPLSGSLEQGSATATVDLPIGFSRFTIHASWTPDP